jgi:putative transposase
LGHTCTCAASAGVTKLKGPAKWTYYYLYVIPRPVGQDRLDVFSRYVVGWMIAERETASLARELIAASCTRQGIQPEQLTLHADRGSSMRSKSLALLLADLGVTKTHSRPYVSNDNPYSEAQFKTLKYRPDYPDRFGSIADARGWARPFFRWYNHDHRHTGLGLMTPAMVHYGQAQVVYQQRQQVLQAAYAAHPERFVRGLPTPPQLPTAVWINRPQMIDEADVLASSTPDTSAYLTLHRPGTGERPEWTLPLDTKFRLELSHNA